MHILPEIFTTATTLAIFGHNNPDGDCLGACIAFGKLCERLGKQVTYFIPDSPSQQFSFLPQLTQFRTDFAYQWSYDLCVFLDVWGTNRVGNRRLNQPAYFTEQTTLVIDHHISNPWFGTHNIIDTNASSTCEIVAEIILATYPQLLDTEISTALFMWLSTDTGHFMFPTATARTFALAQLLIEAWADKESIIEHLYRNQSFASLQWTGTLISRLERTSHGIRSRYTTSELTARWLDQEGIGDSFIFQMTSISHTWRYALFKIMDTDAVPHIRCSLRSSSDEIDVAALAALLGWWGHKRASGVKINLDGRTPEQAIADTVKFFDTQIT
jgi:phosphoesterase RecJ-like protein